MKNIITSFFVIAIFSSVAIYFIIPVGFKSLAMSSFSIFTGLFMLAVFFKIGSEEKLFQVIQSKIKSKQQRNVWGIVGSIGLFLGAVTIWDYIRYSS